MRVRDVVFLLQRCTGTRAHASPGLLRCMRVYALSCCAPSSLHLWRTQACVRPSVRARARVCVRGRARIRAEHASTSCRRRLRVVGFQAFQSASAFIANIGAWNTASVTDLTTVCAVSARSAADALGRSSMRRGRCARRRCRCMYARAIGDCVSLRVNRVHLATHRSCVWCEYFSRHVRIARAYTRHCIRAHV